VNVLPVQERPALSLNVIGPVPVPSTPLVVDSGPGPNTTPEMDTVLAKVIRESQGGSVTKSG
jgi:hypothetical protein